MTANTPVFGSSLPGPPDDATETPSDPPVTQGNTADAAAQYPERERFGAVLFEFRTLANRSRNNLAYEVGVDPSYLTRIEHGDREAPREHIVVALARALRLTEYQRCRLMASAGYWPYGSLSPLLHGLIEVEGWTATAGTELSQQCRQMLRSVVALVQWKVDE